MKRRLYKPERAPARTKGQIKIGSWAPISLPSAKPNEIAMALYSICKEAGFKIGRGGDYDPIRDEYRMIGKSIETGKAQDVLIHGAEVGAVIQMVRNALLIGIGESPALI